MLFSAILTSLAAAGSAYAIVAEGSWGVRADFSRCDPKMPLEAMLDGVPVKSSTTPNITDFRITAPFEGNLVIKSAGAVGYGSPYRPQMVAIKVFDKPTGNPAVWANATVKAGYEPQGLVSWIGWNTGEHTSVGAAEKEDISMETTINGGTLTVDYCWGPNNTAPAPIRK